MTPEKFEEIKKEIKNAKNLDKTSRFKKGMSILSMLTIAGGAALPGATVFAEKANSMGSAKIELKSKESEGSYTVDEDGGIAQIIEELYEDKDVRHDEVNAANFSKVDGKVNVGFNQLDKKVNGEFNHTGGTYISANNIRAVEGQIVHVFSEHVWLEAFNHNGVRTWAIVVTGAAEKKNAKMETPFIEANLELFFMAGQDNNNSYSSVNIEIKGAGIYEFGKGTGKDGIQQVYIGPNAFSGKEIVGVGAAKVSYTNSHVSDDGTQVMNFPWEEIKNGDSVEIVWGEDGNEHTVATDRQGFTPYKAGDGAAYEFMGYSSDEEIKAGMITLEKDSDITLNAEWKSETGAKFEVKLPKDYHGVANDNVKQLIKVDGYMAEYANDIITVTSPETLKVNTFNSKEDAKQLISPAALFDEEKLEEVGLQLSDELKWITDINEVGYSFAEGGAEHVFTKTLKGIFSDERNDYTGFTGGTITFMKTLETLQEGPSDPEAPKETNPAIADLLGGINQLGQSGNSFAGLAHINSHSARGAVQLQNKTKTEVMGLTIELDKSNDTVTISGANGTEFAYALGKGEHNNNEFEIVKYTMSDTPLVLDHAVGFFLFTNDDVKVLQGIFDGLDGNTLGEITFEGFTKS